MVTTEEYNYYQQMQTDLAEERSRSAALNQGIHSKQSLFQTEGEENLVRWQLDLKEDLDRLYHLLKGDSVVEDPEGNLNFVEPTNPDLKPFNEFGVQILMNIMGFYLNRNTILSNYSEEVIEWKILDFGNEVSDLIHNRYDEMMNTLEKDDDETDVKYRDRVQQHMKKKIKLYPMIVKELVDTIHSAYLRAYNAGERESLRTARTVTQNEPLMRGGIHPGGQPQMRVKDKRWFNPTSWAN